MKAAVITKPGMTAIFADFRDPDPQAGEELVAVTASALVLMGSGMGSISLQGLVRAISGVLQAVVPGKLKIDTKVVLLTDVEDAWNKESGSSRIVFVVKQNLSDRPFATCYPVG